MGFQTKGVTTINALMELLRWTCLPHGIITAGGILQHSTEHVENDIDNVIFQDDVYLSTKCVKILHIKVDRIIKIKLK